jgi:hypothetical protein
MTDIERIAFELWWPHHESRCRDVAREALDCGDIGEVTLEFGDFVDIAKQISSLQKQLEMNAKFVKDARNILDDISEHAMEALK